ncbi:MAG: CehA/McbA family metallohydrolase [Lentisphaerota bacterium]
MIFLQKHGLWALRGDFHLHTEYSDGDELERVLVGAINAGLDFIVVTDHDRIAGVSAMRNLVKKMGNPIMILSGCEVTGPGCHLLTYGLDRELPLYPSIAETSKVVRGNGAYFVAAHPAWTRTRSSFWDNHAFHQAWEEGLFDGFELINSGVTVDDNLPVISFWENELLAGRNPVFTAGSDAHDAMELGASASTIVFVRELTHEAIFRAVFRERMAVACSEDKVYGNGASFDIYQEYQSLITKIKKSKDSLSCRISPCAANAHNWTLTATVEENGKVISPESIRFLHTKDLNQNLKAAGNFTTENLSSRLYPIIAVVGGDCERMVAGLVETPVVAELKLQPIFADGHLLWQAVITNRTDHVLRGVSLSWEIDGGDGMFIIPDIEPGRSITNLLTGHEAVTGESEPPYLLAKLHNHDGTIIAITGGAWPIVSAAYGVNASAPFKLTRYCLRDIRREDDVTAQFAVSWNDYALIFDVSVLDHHHHQPYHGGIMYIGDSLQLGIDPASRRSRFNLRDKSVFEYQIAHTSTGAEWTCDARPDSLSNEWPPMTVPELTTCRTEDTIWYRFNLPWSALGMEPAVGDIFGFNLIVNVNDGAGRRGWIELTPGIGDRKSAADWAWMVLSPPSAVKS